MKLSVVATVSDGFFFPDLLVGKSFQAKLQTLKAQGFESVEIWGQDLKNQLPAVKRALKEEGVPVSTVCSGFRGSLLAADVASRRAAFEDMSELLAVAGELGAAGLVFVPVFASQPQSPDMFPLLTPAEADRRILLESLHSLAGKAHAAGTRLLIEPVNRYETYLVNRVDQAVEVCREVGSDSLGVIADTFHMNIEERDMGETIRQWGRQIHHLHLVDSNRLVPGQGHTDFAPIFAALKSISYQGSLSLECFISGDRSTEMPKCAKLLSSLRKQSQ